MSKEELNNLKARLEFSDDEMKKFLEDGRIPNDSDLIAQLSTRKFSVTSKSQIVLESKQLYKKRIKGSPDRADGAVLTLRSRIWGIQHKRAMSFAC